MTTPSATNLVDVTTWYLQMLDPAQARIRPRPTGDWQVCRAQHSIDINRAFYRAVGELWQWRDRLVWSDTSWHEYVNQPGLETWIGSLDNQNVGYFELDARNDSGVEIAYFGLLPAFIGRGLGGALLSSAVERAWQLRPQRVWVHTCTLDHPQALANYLARGFKIYDAQTHRQPLS